MSFTEPLLRHGRAPVVIAHRGASSDHPENTMPAFVQAYRLGAPWIETDVQPTADNALVLIHDDEVDRTTDGFGAVRTLAARALAELDAGGWFGAGFVGARIPRLTDLLPLVTDDRRLLLEIKGDHTAEQLRILLGQIESGDACGRVFLQSFEVPVLARLRALRPADPLGLLVETIADDPIALCARLGASAYNPDFTELLNRPELVDQLHAAGIATMPWTVDDPDAWAALTNLHVDGIITNRPAELLAWQAERPPALLPPR